MVGWRERQVRKWTEWWIGRVREKSTWLGLLGCVSVLGVQVASEDQQGLILLAFLLISMYAMISRG